MAFDLNLNPTALGLLSASGALLGASGPSRYPVSTGQALSAGIGGLLQGYGQGVQLKRTGELMELERKKAAAADLALERQQAQFELQQRLLREAGLLGGSVPGASAGPTGAPSSIMYGSGEQRPEWLPQPVASAPSASSAPGLLQQPQGGFPFSPSQMAAMRIAGMPDLTPAYNASLPNAQVRDGVMYDQKSGRIMSTFPTVNAQGFATQLVPDGRGGWSVQVAPGATDAYRGFITSGEEARAPYNIQNFTIGGREYRMPVSDYRAIIGPRTPQAEETAGRYGITLPSAPAQSGARVSSGAGFGSPTAGERAESEAIGRVMGKLVEDTITASDKAQQQLYSIQGARDAAMRVKQAGGGTGAFQPMAQAATEYVQALGIDPAALGLPRDAGPYQLLDAATKKLALGLIGVPGGMPANLFSEADRKYVEAANARRTDTEEGFMSKLDMAEKIAKRTVEAERSMLDARSQGKSIEQWRSEWNRHANANPIFRNVKPASAPQAKNFTLDDGRTVTGTLDRATGKYFVMQGGKKFWVEE